jgi:hypothetical protein
MKIRFALALTLALGAAPALAQTHTDKNGTIVQGVSPVPNSASGATKGATVGTSDAAILSAAATTRYYLDVRNLSPSAIVCLNFGATATISGTTCSAGEITLPPLWRQSWESSFVPPDAIHAISSAASTPVTVTAF